MPSQSAVIMDQMFYSLIVGISVLWLMAHKLAGPRGFFNLIKAFGIFVLIAIFGILSYAGIDFSDDTVMMALLLGMIIFILLLSVVLSRWRCRKKFRSTGFMLWLAAGCIILSTIAMPLFMIIQLLIFYGFQESLSLIVSSLVQAMLMGFVMGLILFAIIFPFMITGLHSSFLRERFFLCLGLKPQKQLVDIDPEAENPESVE